MLERCAPPLKMRTYEKFDGSVWRQYETPESLIVLTGVGRELVARSWLGYLLRSYIHDYTAETLGDFESQKTRSFLAEGGSAKVFSVGSSRLVIKEARPTGDQLLPALERMDTLIHSVERHCPRWIDIPKHYGVMISKRDISKQFMLMEKIDDGVTVGDILHYDQPRESHLTDSIDKIYGDVTPELQEDIAYRYHSLIGELKHALIADHLSPDTYLPDIVNNPYNVVIDRIDTPVAGSNVKFWVIDQ